MTARVLSPGSGASFPSHTRTKPPPTGFPSSDASPPRTILRINSPDVVKDVITTPYQLTSQLNTPDSGFSGAAVCTPLKTPESGLSSRTATPPCSGNSGRRRKTVTINESQTSIVMIPPDDLIVPYSRITVQSQARLEAVPLMHGLDYRESHEQGSPDHPDAGYLVDNCTGWPLTRTDSLESRDNPFLPGGELSRETEDLLSRATIVRDNFFLNENEKQALRDQQQQLQHQQQMSGVKHGSTHEKPWDHVHSSSTRGYSLSQPGSNEITEESTQVHASQSPLLAVASNSSTNGGNINQPQPQENGKIGDNGTSPDVVLISVPDDDNQSALGQSGTTGDADRIFLTADLHDSDKKYGKKCCNMM
uniref:Uncharacterized protein n=1 Tax=Arion vulgaris TaxID=1028688 RepID=A0A0B6ZIF2_9EUPU